MYEQGDGWRMDGAGLGPNADVWLSQAEGFNWASAARVQELLEAAYARGLEQQNHVIEDLKDEIEGLKEDLAAMVERISE